MKNIFKSFFSLLLWGTATLCAQEPVAINDSGKELPPVKLDSLQTQNDSIYRGLSAKIDLFTPIYTMASTSGNTSAAEIALSVNLLNKYFPTIELGYASCNHTAANDASYMGTGAYTRFGVDFNIMKDKSKVENLFFAGVRAGMALQEFDVNNIEINDAYWNVSSSAQFTDVICFDAWAEILAGVQVDIYKQLHLGWTIRYKYLLTKSHLGEPYAWYVPGFGRNAGGLWGFNYYVGYTF